MANPKSNNRNKQRIIKEQPKTAFVATAGATSDSLVPVTYTLTKSNDVVIKRLFIGDTKIDLEVDQDPGDPNKFATHGSKKYMCINDTQGLKVVVRADGKAGGSWSLEIERAGAALADNPIEEETDANGNLDHNKFHN